MGGRVRGLLSLKAFGPIWPIVASLTLASCASASPRGEGVAAAIFEGTPLGTCEWPGVAALDDKCSGVLVHEELVLFAGHCGTNLREATFGSDSSQPTTRVGLERCAVHPDAQAASAMDFGYCWLARPVRVPITPIAMGCELTELRIGWTVSLVGFGLEAVAGNFGVKRAGTSRIVSLGETLTTGPGSGDGCRGDSGGPVYVRLSGGQWRVLAVQSAGLADGCNGSGGIHAFASNAMSWLELETGLDLSPCWDQGAASWAAGARCQGFPAHPDQTSENDDLCSVNGAVEPPSEACGPPFVAQTSDQVAPSLSIISPAKGAVLAPAVDGAADVHVVLAAEDAGSGVKGITLVLEGPAGERIRRVRELEPFQIDVTLRAGTWTLEASAADHEGNERVTSHRFFVGGVRSNGGCCFRQHGGSQVPSALGFAVIALACSRRRRSRRC